MFSMLSYESVEIPRIVSFLGMQESPSGAVIEIPAFAGTIMTTNFSTQKYMKVVRVQNFEPRLSEQKSVKNTF